MSGVKNKHVLNDLDSLRNETEFQYGYYYGNIDLLYGIYIHIVADSCCLQILCAYNNSFLKIRTFDQTKGAWTIWKSI